MLFLQLHYLLTLLAFLIVGSILGSRHAYFRNVDCIDYVTCPKTELSNKWYYKSGDICITIRDPQGVESIGVLDITHRRSHSVPQHCWTDGFHITTLDPYTVMWCTLMSLALFSILIGLVVFWFIPYKYPKDDDYSFVKWSIAIYSIIITFVYFIAMVATYDNYDRTWYSVICIKYVNTYNYIHSVQWNDTRINHLGVFKMLDVSKHPTHLPAPCWINDQHATFYDPNDTYIYMTIIYVCLMGASIINIILLLVPWMSKKLKQPCWYRCSTVICRGGQCGCYSNCCLKDRQPSIA